MIDILKETKARTPFRKSLPILIILFVLICLVGTLFWFSPLNGQAWRNPLSNQSIDEIYAQNRTLLSVLFSKLPSAPFSNDAVCGNVAEWNVLTVGIDERGSDYLYGLADVIRLVRVNYETPQINVIALPRAILVTPPPGLSRVEPPMLLNQAYFFGSPGMNYFDGPGNGAGALASTLQSNFQVEVENYLVIDFQSFVAFIDAIGGIEIDLPTFVDDQPNSYFPAGVQTLDGKQALTLARVRSKYSDLARIDNQTLILKAIFNRLKNPAVIVKLPQIYASLSGSFQTDASPAQISSLFCLLTQLDSENVNFYNPPEDLLIRGWEFIPNMNQQMEIFRWDDRLSNWIQQSLAASPTQ